MVNQKIIMYESPEAASVRTVTGWVASTGQFWGDDEHMARYVGSTHQQCKKSPDHPAHAKNSYCCECRKENLKNKYAAMPRRVWDMKTPVALYDTDRYFFDSDELRDHMFDEDISIDEIQLVWCKPVYAAQIDPNEYFCDDLPEDGEVSSELAAAFDALNAVIAQEGPLCWFPKDEVATLPADFLL